MKKKPSVMIPVPQKSEVLFYIENKDYIIAVTDEREDTLYGVQVYPVLGTYWDAATKDVQDAYKLGLCDFTRKCSLILD
jgi:hypothetical protein